MSNVPIAVDSALPARIIWLNALQHISLSAVTLIFPRIVAQAAGADPETITRYVSLAMVAMGIGSLIQGYGRRGIGSGHLLLGHCTILYVPFAVEAAKTDGLGAVACLTIVAGLTEMALSRCLRVLRPYVPPEIIGVVITLLGIALGVFGLKLMIGAGPNGPVGLNELVASCVTLATIVSVALWGTSGLRSLAVLVGVATGCAAYTGLEIISGGAVEAAQHFSAVSLTWPLFTPSMPLQFLPGFLIGAMACFVRAIADLTACQQLTNPKWKAPDYKQIRAGTLADGIGCVVAGVLGVLGTNTYSGSVGLAAANGVHSRLVGIAAGIGWIVLGLTPGAAGVLYAIPAGVLGAACFYSATFTLRTGLAMLSQRLLDARRTLVIGSGIVVSVLTVDVKGLVHLPLLGQQILNSPLAAAMLVALALNAIMRLGISRDAKARWSPSVGPSALRESLETQGRLWGARIDLISRAESVLEEFALVAPLLVHPGSDVLMDLRYNEVGLQIELSWKGEALDSSDVSRHDSVDIELQLKLLRHWADELKTESKGSSQTLVAYVDDR
jgi:xanthine/uracil permease